MQALFLLVLIKDYGATRSGGAAKLRQVDQTAPKARDVNELQGKIAKQSANGASHPRSNVEILVLFVLSVRFVRSRRAIVVLDAPPAPETYCAYNNT